MARQEVHGKVSFIKWQEPPARSSLYKERQERASRRVKRMSAWEVIQGKLQERPGEWALIRVSETRPVILKKSRRDLEVVTRQIMHNKKEMFGVFARYNPNNQFSNGSEPPLETSDSNTIH